MAIFKEDPSKRRRSIAVTNQNRPTIAAPVGKRRAHSIVPGDRLSPLAKARRSLAPRKSILKASSAVNTEEPVEQSLQPSSTQSSLADDANATDSMDFTVDYHARVHDNASRKSFGRRVSFAEHAQVRLFQIPNDGHTNSTGSPQSSPILSSSPEVNQPPTISNENDYPARNRRRSSVRYSMAGSDDMDLTSANPGAFLQGEEGSALMDQEMEFGDDDMEVTGVLHGDMARRRSLGGGRQPFAPVRSRETIVFPSDDAIPSDDDDITQAQSVLDDDSREQSVVEEGREEMEFTVPMGQSLRPPPTEDPMWLALRQVTHSGDTPHEPEASSEDDIQVPDGQQGMDLNDAVARLMRARESMGGGTEGMTEEMEITAAGVGFVAQEDSFLSTDDSLDDDIDQGNETLNVSRVVGRMSLGGNARMSLGYQDSTMDESGIYGSAVPPSSTPRPSIIPPSPIRENSRSPDPVGAPRPTVFQPPPEETNVSPPQPISTTPPAVVEPPPKTPVFTFVPPPTAPMAPRAMTPSATPASPAKPKPKPKFSAAFAPPVAKPSPKKPTGSSTPLHGTPKKRPFSVMQDDPFDNVGRPSPAKRPALNPNPAEGTTTGTPKKLIVPPRPRMSLSPSRAVSATGQPAPAKRQSGYFARRKSLGSAIAAPQGNQIEEPAAPKPTKRVVPSRSTPSPPPPNPVIPAIVIQVEEPLDENAVETGPSTLNLSAIGAPPASASLPIPPTFSREASPLQSDEEHVDRMGDSAEATMGAEELETPVLEDMPPISIEEFFSKTGVKFMDELTAPRRSIHPHTGSRQARNSADIPLSEYYIAMGIDVPQLGLFTRVSKDLEGWIARSKADFAQAEEEATKITPELFIEFMRADQDGQAELMHQLNLIRSNARGQAKSDWYDWKLKWVEGLQITAERVFDDLQSDAKILEPIKKAAEELVPTLEKEYNEILQEFEREQAEVAEIEASDQEYLNDLKVSIAEQNVEVEALRAELSEHTDQLNYLRGRLQELSIGEREATDAIAKAQHVLQMKENSTEVEVFRLRDELETLEDLHRFHITRVDENLFEYIYASHLKVVIPCKNFLPISTDIDIIRVGNMTSTTKDDFPQLSNILLQAAKALIRHSNPHSCKKIVQRLSDYWSSCAQLRAQLRLLSVKYPIEFVEMDAEGLPGFKARAKVMILSRKAKVFVTFSFTLDTFSRWPLSIKSLTHTVDVCYGDVEQNAIAQTVSERLNQVTSSDNYACLLDACIEAEEIYHQ